MEDKRKLADNSIAFSASLYYCPLISVYPGEVSKQELAEVIGS